MKIIELITFEGKKNTRNTDSTPLYRDLKS